MHEDIDEILKGTEDVWDIDASYHDNVFNNLSYVGYEVIASEQFKFKSVVLNCLLCHIVYFCVSGPMTSQKVIGYTNL